MDLEICRVCRQNEDLLSIDDLLHEESNLTILESMTVCSGSEISKSDGLPYFICDFCLDELKITYIFLQKLQESTEILTNQLKLNTLLKEEAQDESSRISDSPDTEAINSESQDQQEQIYTFVFDDDNTNPPKSESEELNVEEVEEEIQSYEEVDFVEGTVFFN